ncbi:SWPV1-087 [Shearwaterpox virus]|uniref:SWPV1-087 n=1 Tax=Shearwaterpox virus TaxID=1974596 RepID=A0A1V0S7T9_CNPV|nr:SWPV1-087 [Shearwaterpox virus]
MDIDEENRINDWIKKQCYKQRKVILIASGGTRVSLEKNAVRFLENFSTGMRGAISVEKFIEKGYAVCFLHRDSSLFPWIRNLPSGRGLLDLFEIKNMDTYKEVFSLKDEDKNSVMVNGLKSYKKALDDDALLVIDFTCVYQYLKLLQKITEALSIMGSNAMIYLAAAVSDFYIPYEDMPEHKIDSTGEEITIKMKTVPKMLSHLVNDWAPNAFVVSFKLETDDSIVIKKARDALTKYKHHAVIANLMKDRRTNVVIITKDSEHNLVLSEKEKLGGKVIEDKIVESLVMSHLEFITNSC